MKKIIIFSSSGGGGHTAVSNALDQYLRKDYFIQIAHAFDEVLEPLDFLQATTNARISGEAIYNYAIARRWYSFLNIYYKAGAVYFNTLLRSRVRTLFDEFITIHKPDLIISVIPLINGIILEAAQEKNIPFLLAPTDLDISTFIYGIERPHYNKFHIALPFEIAEINNKISSLAISKKAVTITGFIVRQDFFEKKDLVSLKTFYGIDHSKPTILLLLGAVGLQSIYNFAYQLSYISQPINLIICIGKQEKLKDRLKTIPFPSTTSIIIISFTDRISDLMAISDILITKSGSVSVCEAIYMNLPLILDATSPLLSWERYNHRFIKEHQFGTSLHDLKSIPFFITELLKKHEATSSFKKNIFDFNKKHGGQEIKNLIKKILEL